MSSPSSSKSVFPPGLSAHRCSKSPPDQKLSSASFCSLRFADSLSSSTVVGFVFSSSSSLSSPSPVSTTTTSLGEAATKERFPPPRFAAADVVRTAAHRPGRNSRWCSSPPLSTTIRSDTDVCDENIAKTTTALHRRYNRQRSSRRASKRPTTTKTTTKTLRVYE